RSFKYHRARGPLTFAGQDANTMVQLPSAPNALADRESASEGLRVQGQNFNGSLRRDKDAFLGRFSNFLPVGFYYRAFFKPKGIWPRWARFFRKKAGLGVIDTTYEAHGYDKKYLFCDVLVVGGGGSGLSAAIAAAKEGKDVILADENPVLGGALNYSRPDAQGTEASQTRSALLGELESLSNVRVMTDATVNGWYSDNWLPIIRGKRLYKTRAKEAILCTGALEQLAVFRNNDLPGILLGSAAQRLIALYGVRPGERAVILAGNDQAYGVALSLLDAGIEIAAVVELRETPESTPRSDAVKAAGVSVKSGATVYAAIPDSAGELKGVEVRSIACQGIVRDDPETISCDLLCLSVGFMPAYQLACQAGASLDYDDTRAVFSLTSLPPGLQVAGAVNGYWSLAGARDDAQAAVAFIDSDAERRVPVNNAPTPNYPWPIFAHPNGKEFVDLDEDLQIADIRHAVLDGYEHVQLVKRFSTCGMGPSQGRHSALPMARIVAAETGRSVAETGVTTARPPFAAETIAHCAGRSFYPERRTAMHERHEAAGVQWMLAGNWYRPAYYGNTGERDAAIAREVAAVRSGVGLIDVSTLGGLELRGPDAGELMNRVYTMGFAKMPVKRARYALMTNEAGVVIDDGVACRFSPEHYYVTATTGGVERVYQSLLKWQAMWGLDADVANVTSALAAVNLAGPKSRQVLERVCDDVDVSADAFGYMEVREGSIAGIPCRLIRVGFVGELGFEIHVPQQFGQALWDVLIEAGRGHDLCVFGVEAQRQLRLEKGHVIIGQDTDAMTTPAELGMQWAVSKKKPFFVGGRSLQELGSRPAKRALVGFRIASLDAPLPKESQLVIEQGAMIGRVTSAGRSPKLNCIVGLAYVPPEYHEVGTALNIRCDGGEMVRAEVCEHPFYDPDNQRQAL
ncbi:MAG: glycine cleavage T C-terminal barrel domain-containing protein, partial [Pseudomonadota bacterium]